MADKPFEVIIDGGGPWGFRLQGGKDFGIPLNIARVTPGSKAAIKLLSAGDIIQEINNVNTENLNHMEAQNLIKNAGTRLQLKIKKGKGVSIGDQNAAVVGNPKLLTETKVVHSANIDHGFNTKPRAFGSPSSPPPSVSPAQPVTVSHSSSPPPPPPVSAPKFDSGAYARRKKEELEQRKKEQNIQAEDSEILKMINATHISSKSPPPPQSNEEAGADPGAFRMVYSGRDIHEEASPGAKSVISSLKEKVSQEKSGLNSESKVPSRAFQMLQKQLDEEDPEDLPPPPPELIGGEEEEGSRPSFGSYAAPGVQSRTFRHLQEAVETGDGHQSVFSRPHGERNKAVPLPSQQPKMVAPQVTTVNPIPKAPMPTGPNFKISSTPKAPSFKANAPSSSSSSSSSSYKPPYNASPTKNPPTSPPAFKPSPSPQAVVTPQTTTAKVPSSKPAGMPLDPSRIPVCHGCNDQIKGPFVSAIGKTWHPEHFCCDSCKKSLQNQGFVEEADKLYCEQCFNRYFAPKCASCGHAIIGVNGRGTMLCNYCTTVRSTGEELEPRSLRELIISIKHDIQQENSRTNQLIALKEDALMRWKTAYGRQREVRKDLVEIEEKNQRLEQRLENAENRLKMINSNLKTIEENKSQLKGNERDRKQNEEWLTNEVEKARKRNKIMMQELSKKLSFLSQRGLHLRFIQDKSDSSRLRIIDLENDIELLRRRKEFIISQGKAAASNRIREFALIEQLQDDIMICNRRSEKAKSKIYQYEIRKDDLIGEIEYQRERRREAIDHLQSAIKVKENQRKKMFLYQPVQHYR